MKRKVLAETVMQRMGVDPALIGDVIEKRAAGASRLWLWRQVLFAVVITNATAVWRHQLMALRALAVGAMASLVIGSLLRPIERSASNAFGLHVGNYLLEAGHDSLRWAFMHYHMFDLPSVLMACIVAGSAGWLVGRTHRQHQAAMVLLVTVVSGLYFGYWVLWMYEMARVVPKMNVYPYMPALSLVLGLPCMVTAGLWRSSRPATS